MNCDVFNSHHLSRLPGDANEKVVQEVGTASEAQHGVGQLEGEVGRLAQLTGCMRGEGEGTPTMTVTAPRPLKHGV